MPAFNGAPPDSRWYSLFRASGWILAGTLAVRAQETPGYSRELPKVQTGDPIFQFNGKDLSGFYTYLHDSKYDDPKKVFSVRDGVLGYLRRRIWWADNARRIPRLRSDCRVEMGRANVWLEEAKRARLGPVAPLRRVRRGSRRQLDGVAGMPDHRRGLWRSHHGGRPAATSRV